MPFVLLLFSPKAERKTFLFYSIKKHLLGFISNSEADPVRFTRF
uniref:Uncharacterized protein n=1 Tax=Rhizophora mucronata TaxID=61149 RepID=A0A2P2QTM2_RHIMU